jgi:glycosyltransferase involved in cell wall biosynthesis
MPELIENLVSTIIPVYNRPKMLVEAVESVLAQTYRPIEIIISDDGSTDETARVIKDLEKRHPDVIRSVFNEHKGPGPTREAGRLLARGEFIQYLDSDDLLLPNKFDVQVKSLRAHPECGISYGFARSEGADACGSEPLKWTGREILTLFPALLVDRWWTTNSPLYRRSLCDQIGPWSDLRWSQDWEYDARFGALNTRLVQCKEFICVFRHHTGVRQTTPANEITEERLKREWALIKTIFASAQAAGVSSDAPEMQHFSRWVFMASRWCGSIGMQAEAVDLLCLAKQAAGPVRSRGIDFRLFSLLVTLIGWKPVCKLALMSDHLRKRPGKNTIPWSWVK